MKAVLISIRPKWCEKIVNGEKTIEVRKTRPKLETPFKCYIYCTLPRYPHEDFIETAYPKPQFYSGGKVIGEFVCDWIYQYSSADHLYGVDISHEDMARQSCLTRTQIEAYELKNAPEEGYGYLGVFGWHVSNLKIYDEPRELGDFWLYNEELHKRYEAGTDYCCYDGANEYGEALTDCGDAYLNIRNCLRCWNEWSGWCHHIKRAPQSWCYVEEEM